MNDPLRPEGADEHGRYTLPRKLELEMQGWEFADATWMNDTRMMYVITGYRIAHDDETTPMPYYLGAA